MKPIELEEVTRTFLDQFDGPCPSCGFRLQKTPSSRCSECGFRLSVALTKPHKCTSWKLFMFGLVASFGVCFDQLGLFFAARVYQGTPIEWKWVLPELLVIAVLLGCIYWWWNLKSWASRRGR
ncbi:MAG: hypothetical protein P8N28_01610, partial [Phycisphaerales bacterium]|nr:hypothetical protein [Phycisphaerales bacterium]